jgi:pilus assembly protein Flp/PilA
MTKLNAFLHDEAGVSAVEYVLLLAIIGGGLAAGASTLGVALRSALSAAADALTTS